MSLISIIFLFIKNLSNKVVIEEDVMKSGLTKLKIFVFLIIAVLMAGTASAGLIEQNNVTDLPTIGAGASIGQTFTAIDTSTIETISFYFLDNWGPSSSLGMIGIDVFSGSGYSGTMLGSESFSLSAGAYGFQSFNLTSGIDIISGNIYSVRLTPTADRWAVGKNQIVNNQGINNGFDYLGGDAIINGQINTNNDLAFKISSTVVPEPISSVLFVIGGSVLAGRRFMKKRK